MENTENTAERAGVWVRRLDAILEMESLFYDAELEPIQGYDAELEALHTLKLFVMDEVGRKETPAVKRRIVEKLKDLEAKAGEFSDAD